MIEIKELLENIGLENILFKHLKDIICFKKV
jgi:hypothetical protein